MIEEYFTFKIWSDFIVPIIAFVVICLLITIAIVVSAVNESRKEKFLTKSGFEKDCILLNLDIALHVINTFIKILKFLKIEFCI